MPVKAKKAVKSIIAVIAAAIVIFAAYSLDAAAVYAGKSPKLLPIYAVDTPKKTVAITFDAAWGADKTEEIVKTLNKHGVVGTFFLVGFWVDKYPETVKMIDDNGHEIGNHSNNHFQMSKLTRAQLDDELLSVADRVEKITGKRTKVFRPPFGDYNNALIEAVEKAGMTTIQWDVDSLDWKGLTGEAIVDRIIKRVKSGSIILCHNNSDHILDALPILLPRLIAEGYAFVNVSNLIYKDNYSIDNNGVQHSAK